jgi:cysteinyl-tRNA synthetase
VLGILTHAKAEEFPVEALALLEERQVVRKAKNFARADEIRDALKEMGFTVEDTATGPKLKKL